MMQSYLNLYYKKLDSEIIAGYNIVSTKKINKLNNKNATDKTAQNESGSAEGI